MKNLFIVENEQEKRKMVGSFKERELTEIEKIMILGILMK